jgi:hypothetical protein
MTKRLAHRESDGPVLFCFIQALPAAFRRRSLIIIEARFNFSGGGLIIKAGLFVIISIINHYKNFIVIIDFHNRRINQQRTVINQPAGALESRAVVYVKHVFTNDLQTFTQHLYKVNNSGL